MFSVNSNYRVISFLISKLLCELTCLKKRDMFEYVLSTHTVLLVYGMYLSSCPVGVRTDGKAG